MPTDTAPAPAFGKTGKPKNKAIIVGGVAVGGAAIGILYFRHKSSANTSAASADTGIDPNTGVPYSQEAIDPSTGVPYADESSYGAMGAAPGALGTYNPLTGQYTPGLGTTPTVTAPASNAIWEQAAIQQLQGLGFDPVAAATSIGLYLQGAPLTSDQYSAVAAALGLEGQPPGGAPPIVQISGGGTGNSGNGSTGSSQTNPAPQPSASGGNTTSNVSGTGIPDFGNTVGSAITAALNNGWTVNSISSAGNPGLRINPGNQQQYWNTPLISTVPYPSGVAGQHPANSVSLAIA